MIAFDNNVFYLTTENTSYWFQITKYQHLEQVYYVPRLEVMDPYALTHKRVAQVGSSVLYNQEDMFYCLDQMPLEYSGQGVGDYRISPIDVCMADGGYTSDFVYSHHEIREGLLDSTLPMPNAFSDECQTLIVTMKDTQSDITLDLIYAVYEKSNVISRNTILHNNSDKDIVIHKLMSMSLDLMNRNYSMLTLDGGWIKETHKHIRKLNVGTVVNQSTTGASSNRHNPAIALLEEHAHEDYGYCYGFNLIYSGNHNTSVELSNHNLVRIISGINPETFSWTLKAQESFETPHAVMTFSNEGLNGMSSNFHHFVNNHIVPKQFQYKERPIAYNHWEATFMDFKEADLLKHAKKAKSLGMELFVVDDGWFGTRDDDMQGLGDYSINTKKFKNGLKPFVEKINNLGMEMGLWFEPEMVNINSDLYRNHPEYAIKVGNRRQTMGRNQLVLDLCNKDVQDYIVKEVNEILDSAHITYVKWDMNRHISDAFSLSIDNQKEFHHRYILGLYSIMDRIFKPREHILLETCSSGGNRFDLGMLTYGPQIWSSDNTDPIERLDIQEGLSYFYPLSTISAHVSNSPHQQTLRDTPLSTRFNVSSFGVLGYEYDLGLLNSQELKEIKEQIEFYKTYRQIFQYAPFRRQNTDRSSMKQWEVSNGKLGIAGLFQKEAKASMGFDRLVVKGMKDDKHYIVESKTQRIMIERFGALINHILPIKVNPDSILVNTANKFYSLDDAKERYEVSGKMLKYGIALNNQFVGSWYNENTRLLGDHGSTLYVIKEKTHESESDKEK